MHFIIMRVRWKKTFFYANSKIILLKESTHLTINLTQGYHQIVQVIGKKYFNLIKIMFKQLALLGNCKQITFAYSIIQNIYILYKHNQCLTIFLNHKLYKQERKIYNKTSHGTCTENKSIL